MDWTAPWGRRTRICLDRSDAIELTHRDVYGFRIEDQRYGDQSWYLVSVLLTSEALDRIARVLRAPESEEYEPPDPSDPYFVFGKDRPYAVMVDHDPSVVLPFVSILPFDCFVSATQDLSRAEAIAYGWGTPVTRVVSADVEQEPTHVSPWWI